MKLKQHAYILLALAALIFSCSNRTEEENGIGEYGQVTGFKIVTLTSNTGKPTVFVFRKEGNSFLYYSTITEGWSAQGEVKTSLPMGKYKFLIAQTFGENCLLDPNPLLPGTAYEEIKFEVKPDAANPGYLLAADELYLPEADVADSIYAIERESTVSCTLKRAVSQLLVSVKQGYKEGTEFISVPYPSGHSVADLIRDIEIEVSGIGNFTNAFQTMGTGKSLFRFSVRQEEITPEGFAEITGPFIFPPSNAGKEIGLKVILYPEDGSPFPLTERQFTGIAGRNEQLEIRLWLNTAYKLIDITLERTPISAEAAGDQGIWE